ncbi:MAG: TlpA disulfide reductase family protein [Verrucomicrobiae bacterium]|nr:TlpA disulfide reductase family protein [Verrucomicrobiae bacterium]
MRLLILCFALVLSHSLMGADSTSLIGKTEAEITARFGEPKSVAEIGTTRILGYPNMVLEFENGRVIKKSSPPPAASPTPPPPSPPAPDSTTPPSASESTGTGQVLALKFTAIDGQFIDLENYRGKVVLIDFWATWCGPCVREIPHVLDAFQKHHSKGLEIIGISLDKDREKLLAFLKEKGMTWPQYFDGKGWNNEISSKHGIDSIPTMWLIDKEGRLISKNVRGNLNRDIEQALSK